MNRIGERIFSREDYPLQKFMSFEKYSDLLTKSLLYVARSDDFNDTEESYIFIKESISALENIERDHKNLCKFIPYEAITDPNDRINFLLDSIFNFYHPRHMVSDGKDFIRPEYDEIRCYNGFDSNSAKRVFDCDVKILRENTFITCFCSNTSITDYMCKNYGEIIIRTSKDKLIQSISSDKLLRMTSYPVTYFEEDSSKYRDMSLYMKNFYGYSIFGCKRKCYVEEEEFRLVFSNVDFNSTVKKNILLNIDLNQLIDEIIVINDVYFEKIQKINKKYGYDFNITIY